MSSRPRAVWLLLSLAHFIATFGTVFVLLMLGGSIDSEPAAGPRLLGALKLVSYLLMSPAGQLWTALEPGGSLVSVIAGHLLFVANSAVWGWLLTLATRWVSARRARARAAQQ